MDIVQKDADDISWLEAGNGEPVIFLHGMPGSSLSWQPQMENMAHKYRIIAWDMPGYGKSVFRKDLENPEAMAERFANWMKMDLKLEKAHIVGLSLGAMIAMELALSHPELVDKLVLLDTSPKFGLDGNSDAQEFINSVALPMKDGMPLSEMCYAILTDLMSSDHSQEDLQKAKDALITTSEGLIHAAIMIGNHDVHDRLSDIQHKTLVMTGELDTATPPEYGKIIGDLIPTANYIDVPDSGHLSNLENSNFVNHQILSFLSS